MVSFEIIICFICAALLPGSQKIFRGRPNISVGQPILVQPKNNPTKTYCYCTLKVPPRG